MKEVAEEICVKEYCRNCYYGTLQAWDNFKALGKDMCRFPPDQVAKMRDIAKSAVWERWIKEREAKGLPARKLFDRTI